MHASFMKVLVVLFAVSLGACASGAPKTDAEKAQDIVNGAKTTLETFKASSEEPMEKFRTLLPKAQGVMILPGVLKGGLIVAAEGGNGVLLAKDLSGRWSHPAFYFLAAGSVGLQAGGQASDVVMLIFNRDAVESIIEHQGKLGADLGIVVGTVGAGMEASTTTNVGADILAFSLSMGAFGGGSLEAAALVRRNDFNEAYYGRPLSPQAIVLDAQAQNAGADALRAVLAGN